MSCIKDALEYALHAFEHLHNTQTYQGDNQDFSDEIITMRAALAELEQEPAQAVPVAWKHDCAALLTNGVELWIDRCPHCGKPRTTSPAPLDSDTRKMVMELCESIIDAEDCNVLADDVIDFNLPRKIKERLEAGNEH